MCEDVSQLHYIYITIKLCNYALLVSLAQQGLEYHKTVKLFTISIKPIHRKSQLNSSNSFVSLSAQPNKHFSVSNFTEGVIHTFQQMLMSQTRRIGGVNKELRILVEKLICTI